MKNPVPPLSSAVLYQPWKKHLLVPCLSLAIIALCAAGPGPDYGPEVEARYLQSCEEAETRPLAITCRHAMERLQAQLGYEVFLEMAGTTSTEISIAPAVIFAALTP